LHKRWFCLSRLCPRMTPYSLGSPKIWNIQKICRLAFVQPRVFNSNHVASLFCLLCLALWPRDNLCRVHRHPPRRKLKATGRREKLNFLPVSVFKALYVYLLVDLDTLPIIDIHFWISKRCRAQRLVQHVPRHNLVGLTGWYKACRPRKLIEWAVVRHQINVFELFGSVVLCTKASCSPC